MSAHTYLDKSGERLLKILAVALITLIAFENLAVTTAMPSVARELGGMDLFSLASGIVLAAQLMTTALAGPWSDARGPAQPLVGGLVLFAAGLVVCAVAPSMAVFVLGRAVEGLGGGFVIVPLYAMVGASVRPANQPPFFAAFAAAWVVPSLVGPAVAGFAVERWTWRLIFGAVPVLLLSILPLVGLVVRRTPALARTPQTGILRTVVPAVASGVVVAILQLNTGAKTFTWLTYAVIGVCALSAFLFLSPLFPAGTYRLRRGLPATVLTRIFLNGAFIAMELFIPLMLQDAHGWTPAAAGYIMSVGSVTWAIGSWLSGRVQAPRLRLRLPFIGAALGTFSLWCVVVGSMPTAQQWIVVVAWAVAGLGVGTAYPALTVHALTISSLDDQGRTSAALQLADTYGSAFCTAVMGVVLGGASTTNAAPTTGLTLGIATLTALFTISAFSTTRIAPPAGSPEAARLEDPLAANPRMAEVTNDERGGGPGSSRGSLES